MKIAAFYSDSPFAGWVQCQGFAEILERMGHEVIAIPVPATYQVTQAQVDKINKPIDDCELILVSGPEWLRPWIQRFYPQWNTLKMPKVGWYHESFIREDFTLDYFKYQDMFDYHFFPDKEDAARYKGEWLPLGVDIKLFHPFTDQGLIAEKERDIAVAFIGLMYPKRAEFFEQVKPHLGDIQIQMRVAERAGGGLHPGIAVFDFQGLNIRRSMELLAETYRRIKVFVTFPSMSRVVVAKVLESLACGCTLVCPKQPIDLPCYEYETPQQCAKAIRQALHTPKWGGSIGLDHHMKLRFEQIFKKAGLCSRATSLPEPADSLVTI